ncbi:MAG TPA: hypothetical protein VKC17_11705, partial [Sphingomicrobium sp.]|nr:hypothetical protein [Sphingomicrobium sp.]
MLRDRSANEARSAARAMEDLIARNALALRIAAAGAIPAQRSNACDEALKALATAPAITRSFALRNGDGALLCTTEGFVPREELPLVAPGDIRAWIDPGGQQVDIRVGVIGGMATASVTGDGLKSAALDATSGIRSLQLVDGHNALELI